MSHSEKSLREFYRGIHIYIYIRIYQGGSIGAIKGDTRSLDYGSYSGTHEGFLKYLPRKPKDP